MPVAPAVGRPAGPRASAPLPPAGPGLESTAMTASTPPSERLRRAETIGRPVGSAEFVAALERQSGRRLRPEKPGRKPAATATSDGQLSALSP